MRWLLDRIRGRELTAEDATQPASETLIERMGRYRVEGILGEGHFGRVYRAWDETLHRPVALKVSRTQSTEASDKEAFLQEARLVAGLDHPNIVPVYDIESQEDGGYFIVSKYIDGTDLSARIRDHRLNQREAASLMIAMAEAVHHAHERGLVHRDVKPSNILLDTTDQPFLTDFGIAFVSGSDGMDDTRIRGTPPYMSPEQIQESNASLDRRTDVWSLGVVLYLLLTARLPFQGQDPYSIFRDIIFKNPRAPRTIEPTLSQELEAICLKALAKPANDRFSTAAEMGEALQSFLKSSHDDSRPRASLGKHSMPPSWNFSAFLQSKRAEFHGRRWLSGAVESWAREAGESVLFILGEPGIGKSAWMAEFIRSNPGGRILSYHCCQADTEETLNASRFVQNLACSLARQLPAFAAELERPGITDLFGNEASQADPASTLEGGILSPLSTLPAPEDGPRFLLLDGLDEAIQAGRHERSIVEILAPRLARFPAWLKWVATTRNDPEVLKHFQAVRTLRIEPHDPKNLEDIHGFLKEQLQKEEIASRLSSTGRSIEAWANVLSQKADGNFLYAHQVLAAIRHDALALDKVTDLPPGLHGLYHEFFRRLFPDEESVARTRPILEVLVASREPLTSEQLAKASGLGDAAPRSLRRLSSFLRTSFGIDGQRRHSLFHQSLIDWLTAPEQEGDVYHVRAARGHAQLADMGWDEIHEPIAAPSPYSISHLLPHLIATEQWERVETLTTDLTFLELMCRSGQTFDLVRQYETLANVWPGEASRKAVERRKQLSRYQSQLLRWAQSPASPPNQPFPRPPDTKAARRSAPKPPAEKQLTGPQAGAAKARVDAFARLLRFNSHMLQVAPQALVPLALHYPRQSPVFQAARQLEERGYRLAIRRDPKPLETMVSPSRRSIITAHRSAVRSVATTTDFQFALAGDDDGVLDLWDTTYGERKAHFNTANQPVRSVDISPDGRVIAAVTIEGDLLVWNQGELPETRRPSRTIKARATRCRLIGDGRLAVTIGSDEQLHLWDTHRGTMSQTIDLGDRKAMALATSFDGQTMVVSTKRHLNVWDLGTGTIRHALRGHRGEVLAAAMTPDGRTAVSCGRDRMVFVWCLDSGRLLRQLTGHERAVWTVALTPDGKVAVSGSSDQTVRAWDLESGKLLRVLRGHTGGVQSICLSPDGLEACSSSRDRSIRVWSLDAPSDAEPELRGHRKLVVCAALSHRGEEVYSAGTDRSLVIWNPETGQPRNQIQLPFDVSRMATRDEEHILLASKQPFERQSLFLWNTRTGERVEGWGAPMRTVSAMALAHNQPWLATSRKEGPLILWDSQQGSLVAELGNEPRPARLLRFSPDDRYLLSLETDHNLRRWDLTNDQRSTSLPGTWKDVATIEFTPDGQQFLVGTKTGTIELRETSTGQLVNTFKGHYDWVTRLALTADGQTVVSASRDRTVRRWHLKYGEETGIYPALFPIYALTKIRPDGRFACGTSDGQMHFLTCPGD